VDRAVHLAVHIKVLGDDQLGAGAGRALQNAGLQRRKFLCPLEVARLSALVDNGRALANLAGQLGIVGVAGRHLHAIQAGRGPAAAIDHLYGLAAFQQFAGHRLPQWPGSKNDVCVVAHPRCSLCLSWEQDTL
jgi:hypothetical protein